MKLSKKQLAEKIGYEYLGKGFDDAGNEGFVIRKLGTTEYKIIGQTQGEAYDWLMDKQNN